MTSSHTVCISVDVSLCLYAVISTALAAECSLSLTPSHLKSLLCYHTRLIYKHCIGTKTKRALKTFFSHEKNEHTHEKNEHTHTNMWATLGIDGANGKV